MVAFMDLTPEVTGSGVEFCSSAVIIGLPVASRLELKSVGIE
jgi:hypothetical protein